MFNFIGGKEAGQYIIEPIAKERRKTSEGHSTDIALAYIILKKNSTLYYTCKFQVPTYK